LSASRNSRYAPPNILDVAGEFHESHSGELRDIEQRLKIGSLQLLTGNTEYLQAAIPAMQCFDQTGTMNVARGFTDDHHYLLRLASHALLDERLDS
jgi:hypothetical protein